MRTILFSPPGLGESLWLAQCVRCGTLPPDFSVSPENAHSRLTRRTSRFTLFGLLAYVYSGGCEKSGRQARVVELEPKYCDVICRRFMEFSGKTATLESDGRTLADVAAERLGVAA